MSGQPISVYLVDDSELVRGGLELVLEHEPDLVIVGGAGTVEDAARDIEQIRPRVTVVDLRLGSGRGDGLQLCRLVAERRLETEIVILSAFLSEGLVQAAFRVGARGYVLKEVEPAELAWAIRSAAEGKTTIDPKVSSIFGQWASRLEERLGVRLRGSEIRVLQVLCSGAATTEIAERTGLSVRTVRSYLSDCFQKLGVRTRTEAVGMLLRAGLEPAPLDDPDVGIPGAP